MQNPFLNGSENRLRAGWRIIGQFFLMYMIGFILIPLFQSVLEASLAFGIVMLSGALASTWAAAKGLDKRAWSEFGIQSNTNWIRESLAGFGLAGVAIAVIFIVEYIAGWVSIVGYGYQTLESGAFLWSFITYFLFMICVGFYEELVYRGYQITNLSEGFNLSSVSRRQATVCAVVLTSMLFGALHLFNPNAGWFSTVNIAVAGVMLAFPYLITGRLSYSIGLHIGWNFFQGGVFGFAVSGLRYHASLMQIEQNGPEWLTGGVFGPEAGLMGLCGMILIIGGLVVIFKFKEQLITIDKRFGIYEKPE